MKTLETKRLILRDWQLDDLDDLYEYAQNPHVGPIAGWKPHSSKNVSLDVLKSFIKDGNVWAIVLKENRKVIGSIRLYPDENRGKYKAKSINFVLSYDYWGNGFMTEAVKCVVEHAFTSSDIDLLSVFHYPHNTRSKRVIEKCGFEYEGTLEQTCKRYDGQIFDAVCYSLLRADYFRDLRKIKPVNKTDLPECLDVIRRSYETVAVEFGLTEENCPDRGRASLPLDKLMLSYEEGEEMYAYYVNGHIVGLLCVHFHHEGFCKLNDIVVLPEFRHNGYGKELLDFCKAKARENGAVKIRLGMIDDNTVLKKWYLKNGFINVGFKKYENAPFTVGNMECIL